MKLWLLQAAPNRPAPDPWAGEYDMNYGFVFRAETEEDARTMASKMSGDENYYMPEDSPWLNPKQSTCIELLPEGKAGLILQDFHAG